MSFSTHLTQVYCGWCIIYILRLELKRLFLQENTLEKWRSQADKFLYKYEARNIVLSPKDVETQQSAVDSSLTQRRQ